jgi:hypothetical protein
VYGRSAQPTNAQNPRPAATAGARDMSGLDRPGNYDVWRVMVPARLLKAMQDLSILILI